jgi:hypothetical protein
MKTGPKLGLDPKPNTLQTSECGLRTAIPHLTFSTTVNNRESFFLVIRVMKPVVGVHSNQQVDTT